MSCFVILASGRSGEVIGGTAAGAGEFSFHNHLPVHHHPVSGE
jgi:hypothetical protein